MSDVLSQDEVDALLKGVQSGDIGTEEAKTKIMEGGLRAYDLTSQERIVRGRMPGLEMSNERFTRYFRNSVSTLVRKFVDINIHNVAIVKFGEFMKSIPFPSSINMFKMEPLKGVALLVVEAPLVFAFVEFFFGGATVRNVKSEGRAFTSIEQSVIKKVVNLALHDLAAAWTEIAQFQPEHTGAEMNPQFVTIVTPSEIVIKVEVHIEVDNFTGKMFFCFPYSMIEPVKEKLYSGLQGDTAGADHRWIGMLKEILAQSPVTVSAELGVTSLTFGDVMSLKEGDVLTLNRSTSDDLLVRVQEIPKFRGVPGNSRGSQAVKITKVIT